MTREEIVDELAQHNPKKCRMQLAAYADHLLLYAEAVRNLRINGAVCVNPRTGQPLVNPYQRLANTSGAFLAQRPMQGPYLLPRVEADMDAAEKVVDENADS